VLDSLLDGRYFNHFFAASPSLSWADERMMQKIRKLVISSPRITLVTPSFWLKNLVQPTLLSNKEVCLSLLVLL
jgi:hypothetical protein